MSKPTMSAWSQLERIGQYLKGKPRLIRRSNWQEAPATIDVYADSTWVGCRRTRKSTSGGCVMLGQLCINTWSKTQFLLAKSSAESELYGIVKASCEALGTRTLTEELGKELNARVHVDAFAAKGIVGRAGLDRVRHIDVNVLWLQDQEVRGRAPSSRLREEGTRLTS